jgi:putative FmdB family regulatory protein
VAGARTSVCYTQPSNAARERLPVPIYEYRCDDCDAVVEVMQKMSDDPLEVCQHCGGHLRKVLHPVAIHFKGSGFYTTDYGRGSQRRPPKESADGGSGSDAGQAGDDGKPAAKPSSEAGGAAGTDAKAKAPASS